MFILELCCFILINQVAGPYMGTRQCSSSCLKEVFEQAPQQVPAEALNDLIHMFWSWIKTKKIV